MDCFRRQSDTQVRGRVGTDGLSFVRVPLWVGERNLRWSFAMPFFFLTSPAVKATPPDDRRSGGGFEFPSKEAIRANSLTIS